MIPWQRLAIAEVPGEREPLVLYRRGSEYVIRVGARALMSSTAHASEEALATLTCARLAERARPRVLIGGLGMGHTLAAALRVLPPDASVVVAELVGAVVDWNRTHLAELAGRPLDDPRVQVRVADVGECIGGAPAWDAILLDVDNGPDGLTRAENDRLYSAAGLAAIHHALRDGGVLGVWSVAPDDAFTRRLAAARFSVETEIVRARAGKGGRHVLWLATRPGGTARRPVR